MNTFLLPLFIIAILLLWYSNWQFNRLVGHEYEFHHDDWESDGCPSWAYHYSMRISSLVASLRVWLSWLAHDPTWATGDNAILSRLKRWRIATAIGVALFAVVFIGLLLR